AFPGEPFAGEIAEAIAARAGGVWIAAPSGARARRRALPAGVQRARRCRGARDGIDRRAASAALRDEPTEPAEPDERADWMTRGHLGTIGSSACASARSSSQPMGENQLEARR